MRLPWGLTGFVICFGDALGRVSRRTGSAPLARGLRLADELHSGMSLLAMRPGTPDLVGYAAVFRSVARAWARGSFIVG